MTRDNLASQYSITSIYHTTMPDFEESFGGNKMSEKINWNDVAKKVTLKEKGKEQISIAQVKEVLKVTAKILVKDYPDYEILLGLNHLANR